MKKLTLLAAVVSILTVMSSFSASCISSSQEEIEVEPYIPQPVIRTLDGMEARIYTKIATMAPGFNQNALIRDNLNKTRDVLNLLQAYDDGELLDEEDLNVLAIQAGLSSIKFRRYANFMGVLDVIVRQGDFFRIQHQYEALTSIESVENAYNGAHGH